VTAAPWLLAITRLIHAFSVHATVEKAAAETGHLRERALDVAF
jgi:hypothetical protein